VWSGAPPSVPEHPAVAWNGSAYLLAWFDYFPWLSTFGLRVSAEGAPLDAERLELSPHYTSEVAYFPSVAAAGGDWLVAWTLWSYCTAPPAGGVLYAQYATRVDAAGQVLDPAGLAVAQDAGCLTNYWEGGAAFDGAAYLVAYGGWTDPPGGGGVGVARLDPTGAPLAPTPVALSGDPPAGAVGAVYDGHAVLVSWAVASAAIGGAPGPVVAARVAPGGGVIEQGLVIAAEGSLVRTAAEGGHGLAVWLVVEPDGTPSIRGATLESVAPIAVARAGLGSGRVTSWPPGVSCGDTCTAEFYAPSVVTLTATPAGASRFEGWSGDCAGAAPTCTIAADRARSAVATFRAPPVRLAVAVLGGGSGVVTSTPPVLTCPAGKVCSAAVERGATVTLTATADPGSRFLGWLGPCSGAGACTLAMNGDRGVLGLLVRAIARVDYHPGGRAASDGSPAPAGAPAAAPDPPARGP
jgi:hypothetical protein